MIYVITAFRKKDLTCKKTWLVLRIPSAYFSSAEHDLGRLHSGLSSPPFSSLQQRQGDTCSVGRRNKDSYILLLLEKQKLYN